VKFTLAQEAELEEYIHAEQVKANEIKKNDDTDNQIDRMLYALYELTGEGVKIVEGERECVLIVKLIIIKYTIYGNHF